MPQNPSTSSRNPLPSMPTLSLSGTHPPMGGLASGAASGSLLRALRRRWRLAALLAIGMGGLLAGAAWQLVPPHYRAEVRLHVPPPPSGAGSHPREEEVASFQRAQVALAQSPTVLDLALKQNEVADLPVVRQHQAPAVWLHDQLAVEADPRDELLRIRVRGGSEEETSILAQAVAQAYLHEAAAQRRQIVEQVKTACREATERLRAQQEQLARWEGNTRRLHLEKELQQADFHLRTLRTELEHVQKNPPRKETVEVSDRAIREYLVADPAQQQTVHELAALEAQIRAVERVSARGSKDPLLQKLQKQSARMQRQLLAHKQDVLPLVQQKIHEQQESDHQRQLRQLRDRIKMGQKLRDEVQGELARQGAEGNEQQRKLLHDGIARDRAAVEHLQAEARAVESAPVLSRPAETILVTAERRPRLVATAGAGVAGMVFMLMLVSLVESRRRQITAASQVTRELGLRVLGRVPHASQPARFASIGAADTGGLNPITESVDALRTQLLCDGEESPRVILVTSALAGEGKTSLAVWLAASLARGWRKTLLIDGSLRRPEAHTMLGAPLEPGLSEVLRDEVDLVEVIQPTAVSRLWMIPAGHCDTHAIQSLAQPGAAALFEKLREQYDSIVIDGCPILPVADALILSRFADVALLAVRSGMSCAPAIAAAQQQLAGLNVLVPGVVFVGKDDDLHTLLARSGKQSR